MRSRYDRACRAADAARLLEDRARMHAFSSSLRLRSAIAAIDEAVKRTRQLAASEMPLALRGLLTTAGARNLSVLDAERHRLGQDAEASRHRWDQAHRRTRSFQKLTERIEVTRRQERRRAEAAELLDIVSSAAAARAQTGRRPEPERQGGGQP
jgi:hypothetical protein